MSRLIRIDDEVARRLLKIIHEAEGLFGRRVSWSEGVKLAIAEAKFPEMARK